MKPIQLISQDVFDKIRSRFQNLEMGNELGAVTIDPIEARFFDFDFVHEDVNLGRVSISLNDTGSLKVYYSQGITENQDDIAKQLWYNFLKEMRMFAMRRLLRFDTRDIAKNNLDKNDFQYLANKSVPKEEPMSVNESRWSQKSTKKTSRAVTGTTEVIVRHHPKFEETYAGSRSRPSNIRSIYIQNKEGERFKYPFIHPAGAFAMAQHVDHGGIPHDPAGKAIIKMSEQIAQLQEFQRTVRGATLHADATGITERATSKLNELKSMVGALGKRHHYENWIAEFQNANNDDQITELDPVTMESYKDKFTETNFKEEIAKFFPLLHSIMAENDAIDLDEYVDETEDAEHSESFESKEDAFEEFEKWAEAVEQGKLTDDQIEALKQAIDNLQPGELTLKQSGQPAWDFFSNFGIEDTDLEDKLKDMASIDDTTDPMQVFKVWAQKSYPELLVALGMSGTGQEEPQQAQEPEAEPQEPEQAKAENDDAQWTNNTMPAEAKDGKNMIREIASMVKQFYNEDNGTVGPFRGYEGIAIDIGKKIGEKYGDEAGVKAETIAKQFMEKLTKDWESKHGPVPGQVDPDDGLARLKELIGNVKQKVESYAGDHDQATTGRMPEEGADMDKIPAYIRKQKQQSQDTAQKAIDKRNQDSGANVWKSPRLPEEVELLKLAGLAK